MSGWSKSKRLPRRPYLHPKPTEIHAGEIYKVASACHVPYEMAKEVFGQVPSTDEGRAAFFAVWSRLNYELAEALVLYPITSGRACYLEPEEQHDEDE